MTPAFGQWTSHQHSERLLQQLNTYHAARHQIRLDPEARNARRTHLSDDGLTIHQTLIDSDDLNDWSLHLTLDPEKSNEVRTPVLHLESIAPIQGATILLSCCQ